MRTFLFCVIISLIASIAKADLNTLSNSICRIDTSKSIGTGFAYKEDEDNYYLLTAGHLIGIEDNQNEAVLFHTGAQWKVPAKLVWHDFISRTTTEYDREIPKDNKELCCDISVLTVSKEAMKEYGGFKLVEFAKDYKEKKNTLIWSYGCPDGNWPSGFKGRLMKVNENLIEFTPAPIGGRSGSPLMDHDCKKVIGIVTLNFNSSGWAPRIDKIYEKLKEKGLEP
jgi:hypothetical protein